MIVRDSFLKGFLNGLVLGVYALIAAVNIAALTNFSWVRVFGIVVPIFLAGNWIVEQNKE